jgi:hypothetical protein
LAGIAKITCLMKIMNNPSTKHQKPNIKQIPMTEIQNSKPRIGRGTP